MKKSGFKLTLFIMLLLNLQLMAEGGHKTGKPVSVTPARESIHWVSMAEALELTKKEPRKIYIDFYTDWCGWCKKMDRESFTNLKVITEMNKNFYAVKFNAEGKDAITVNQQVYTYSESQHINEFTLAMLDGQIGYPTAVIMGEKGQKITAIPGYQEAPMLAEILSYFGNNRHLSESFGTFQKSHHNR